MMIAPSTRQAFANYTLAQLLDRKAKLEALAATSGRLGPVMWNGHWTMKPSEGVKQHLAEIDLLIAERTADWII